MPQWSDSSAELSVCSFTQKGDTGDSIEVSLPGANRIVSKRRRFATLVLYVCKRLAWVGTDCPEVGDFCISHSWILPACSRRGRLWCVGGGGSWHGSLLAHRFVDADRRRDRSWNRTLDGILKTGGILAIAAVHGYRFEFDPSRTRGQVH
jgi:hypothetical protein